MVLVVCVAQERALAAGGAPGGMPTTAPARTTPEIAPSSVQRSLIIAMIAVAVLEGIVTTVIDLQFIATVKGRYSGDTVAIALSLFYGGTNAILLLLQITAIPRLLVTRSLPFTAAIHPALVIVSYAGFAVAPGFVGIAGTRTADQVLRLATSRTSQELALSALPPVQRARWKVLLRGLVWPAGAAVVAASVLLAIGPRALREPAILAIAAIAIAVVWGIAARRRGAQRFPGGARGSPLGIRATRRDDPRRIDLETLERWTHAAGAGDVKQAALARATLSRARIDATDLADHLRHDDPEVRAAMFDQLARAPAPALRGELRAAIAIEDDDRALALGIKALTMAGDDGGLARGKGAAGLSRDVDDTVRSARAMLAGDDVQAELRRLLARDPAWAAAMIRARRAELPDDVLDPLLRAAVIAPETRAGAFAAIIHAGPERTLAVLATALEAGDADALGAFEELDPLGAAAIARTLATWSPLARATLARTLAAAPSGAPLIAQLVDDRDPEVAYAALRTALAFARGGGALPADRIAAAHHAALAARGPSRYSRRDRLARDGDVVGVRPRRARDRDAPVCRAAAVGSGGRGRGGGSRSGAGRGHRAPPHRRPRRRAAAGARCRPGAPDASRAPRRDRALAAAGLHDRRGRRSRRAVARDVRSVARAAGGGRVHRARADARRPATPRAVRPRSRGLALAALATAAERRSIDGDLFRTGDPGDAMFVVVSGVLVASRPRDPDRSIEAGEVVGELAVLSHPPRAATVVAACGGT